MDRADGVALDMLTQEERDRIVALVRTRTNALESCGHDLHAKQ
jgi:hypothetical protein